jgi:hypothetical protein
MDSASLFQQNNQPQKVDEMLAAFKASFSNPDEDVDIAKRANELSKER